MVVLFFIEIGLVYYKNMRQSLLILTMLLLAPFANAYQAIPAEPVEVYSIIPIEGDVYVERTYLGDLEDAPDLYEFTTDVAISVQIKLLQRPQDTMMPFGIIMVRQNDDDGGVEEILRQNEPLTAWTTVRPRLLGTTLLESPTIRADIKPGTYRIEVSTPDNKGVYALMVGEEPNDTGFFATLLNIGKTYYHFGYSPLHLYLSPYIYGPLAILSIAFGLLYYRRHRRARHGIAT